MPFVRKKNKTFKWPVIVREPSENDAGVFEESEFIAIFKRLKVSEYQKAVDNNWCPINTIECPIEFRRPDLVLDINTYEDYLYIS